MLQWQRCLHQRLSLTTGVVVEAAMEAETGAGIIIEMGLGLTDISMAEIDLVLTKGISA